MKTGSRKTTSASLSAHTKTAVLLLAESEYGSNDEAKLSRVRHLLMDQAEKSNLTHVIVDLSAVDCFGARFIGILLSTWKKLRRRNGRLALCGMTPFCTELMQIVQLHNLFEVYPTPRIAQEEIERYVPSNEEEPRTVIDEMQIPFAFNTPMPIITI